VEASERDGWYMGGGEQNFLAESLASHWTLLLPQGDYNLIQHHCKTCKFQIMGHNQNFAMKRNK
jgi:hypothetical protein